MPRSRNWRARQPMNGPAILIGTPWVQDGQTLQRLLRFSISRRAFAAVRFKVDLPNYGVFDEKRVFVPRAHAAGPGQFPWHPARYSGLRRHLARRVGRVRKCRRVPGGDRRGTAHRAEWLALLRATRTTFVSIDRGVAGDRERPADSSISIRSVARMNSSSTAHPSALHADRVAGVRSCRLFEESVATLAMAAPGRSRLALHRRPHYAPLARQRRQERLCRLHAGACADYVR